MKLGKYIGEVRTELKKATWPWDPKEKGLKKYKQLIDSTVVVLIAMVLLGAYVATIDFAMREFMIFLTTGF
ncbi:MAG: preprotein translocase subunit SecE [Verrucomicrobiales bacterium]|jgi:preprotein translocase subunit SecE|nr:preprotein translocase subunit SecE [Verrucomicrobiales bacterium]MBP82560.1 preprotein translocase subunit SecE [Verrucomicrobiales bacterium]|tara:strand:+ start:132 stop:344 length:213 start_codon:yes stop_codon:yes gene_type:complete